ncbi:glutaredoxin domain-containing protein [Marispirochaeta aestuarii]|uniref:glutaredoxin family protein n=1 Tax=Marispirochaeta aestuarii TaxID=1963862 RepID=UPI002ABE4F89|nr:glutaredoxin domain-containing protein [Marispirochaeta aestuarii]
MKAEYTIIEGTLETPELTLYGLSFCDHCREAKKLLEKMGFSFRYLQVDRLPKKEIVRIKREIEPAGVKTIVYPVLKTDADFLYGFDQTIWEQKLRQAAEVR